MRQLYPSKDMFSHENHTSHHLLTVFRELDQSFTPPLWHSTHQCTSWGMRPFRPILDELRLEDFYFPFTTSSCPSIWNLNTCLPPQCSSFSFLFWCLFFLRNNILAATAIIIGGRKGLPCHCQTERTNALQRNSRLGQSPRPLLLEKGKEYCLPKMWQCPPLGACALAKDKKGQG